MAQMASLHTQTPKTVPDLLCVAAREAPDRLALIDGEVRLSYNDLMHRVATVAESLIRGGIEKGDRVALWLPNGTEWILAALATHWAGAILVPLNTRLTGHEAADLLERCGAKALFTTGDFVGRDYLSELSQIPDTDPARLQAAFQNIVLLCDTASSEIRELAGVTVTPWSELASAEVSHLRPPLATPDGTCDIIFTSGTTGIPKGAVAAHQQTVSSGDSWAEQAGLTGNDVFLLINPMFHTFGYKAGLIACLTRQATMLPVPKFDPRATIELIEAERVTVLPGPPTIYQMLLQELDTGAADLSSLRVAVTGAAMVPVALIERMRRDLAFETVITGYGLSEAPVVTMCTASDPPEIVSTTCGRPTGGFQIRIAAEGDVEVATGELAEIQLKGPNLMQGYFDDPKATAEAISADGWFRTGDIGKLDANGYLSITDRLKDMFTVGGFNVYPAEIEQVISAMGEVADVAVTETEDERLGAVAMAVVVRRAGTEITAEVTEFCKRRLANFKVPRTVQFVEVLPRNAAGKVDKKALRSKK